MLVVSKVNLGDASIPEKNLAEVHKREDICCWGNQMMCNRKLICHHWMLLWNKRSIKTREYFMFNFMIFDDMITPC